MVSNIKLQAEPGAVVRLRYDGTSSSARYRLISGNVLLGSDGLERNVVAQRVVPTGTIRIEFFEEPSGTPEVHEVNLAVGKELEIVLGKEE